VCDPQFLSIDGGDGVVTALNKYHPNGYVVPTSSTYIPVQTLKYSADFVFVTCLLFDNVNVFCLVHIAQNCPTVPALGRDSTAFAPPQNSVCSVCQHLP